MILCFQSEVAGTVSKETTIKSLSVSMGGIETRCLYVETTLQLSHLTLEVFMKNLNSMCAVSAVWLNAFQRSPVCVGMNRSARG